MGQVLPEVQMPLPLVDGDEAPLLGGGKFAEFIQEKNKNWPKKIFK